MNRAAMLREVRMESFERVYGFWRQKRITQAAAGRVLGVTDRTFRRWVARYEAEGMAALRDRRLGCSARRAPPQEVEAVEALYGAGHRDWNVRHFYDAVYVVEGGGLRSYTWVKNRLQAAGLVKKGRGRACGAFGRRWRRRGCSTACTRTAARTTGTRQRRVGRWTRTTRPSSGGRWRSWGSR